MQDLDQGLEELKDVREHAGDVKECRMCKFVLIFSFLVLLAVMTLVFIQGRNGSGNPPATAEDFHSLPLTEEQRMSNIDEFPQRIYELEQTAKLATSSVLSPADASTTKVVGQTVTVTTVGGQPIPQQRPEGPPPVIPSN